MDMPLIQVEAQHDGRVLHLVLGPQPANILSSRAMEELALGLGRAEQDPRVKLVVIRGEGKHFSFGASVEEHRPGDVDAMLPAFHRFIRRVLACPVPTLAQVQGLCLGGGFELALACTFLFADETAKLGVPEIQLGVFPPVAAALLPSRCGDSRAARIVLSGDRFSAKDLEAWGVVSQVASSGELPAAVDAFYEQVLAPKSASSLRLACRAARLSALAQYDHLIADLEPLYLQELMATTDAREGIASFLEKRKPDWKDA